MQKNESEGPKFGEAWFGDVVIHFEYLPTLLTMLYEATLYH